MRKPWVLVSVLLMAATLPGLASASAPTVTPFTAMGTVVRTDPGVSGIDSGTGGLLTTDQIFEGSLASSWTGLDGADVSIVQNSLIGVGTLAPDPSGTLAAPLFGQAWGGFDIAQPNGGVSGTYNAGLSGTLYLDPFGAFFGCPATDLLGPIDIDGDGTPDPVGAYVSVDDSGGWQVAAGSATGPLLQIDQIGGLLMALANGCLGGEESAQLTLTGQLLPPVVSCNDLVISNYSTALAGSQFVDLTNAGALPIDVTGCSFATYSVFTEKSIGAGTVDLPGVVGPGETIRIGSAGSGADIVVPNGAFPSGPGGFAVLDTSAPANGTPVRDVLPDDVTGMVYLSNTMVYGVSHLRASEHNAVYDCIYGGHGTGPFVGGFAPVSGCLAPQ